MAKHNVLDSIKDKVYQSLFEAAGEGLVLVNGNGEIMLTNKSLDDMFCYKKGELLGKAIEVLLPDKFKKPHIHHRNDFGNNPRKRPMGKGLALMGQKKNGVSFSVEISLNHLQTDEGFFVMGLVTDITERKSLEKEHKRVELFLRELHGVTSGQKLTFKDKINALLHLSCKNFNTPIGAYSRIENIKKGVFKSDIGVGFKENLRKCTLFKDLSQNTVKSKEVFFLPSYKKLKSLNKHCNVTINQYFSIKVIIDGKCSGILSFFGQKKRTSTLSNIDMEILKLISEWTAAETYREQVRRELNSINNTLEQKVEERTKDLKESEKLYKAISRNFPDGTINVLDKNLDYVFVEGKELYKHGITSQMLIGTNYIDRIPLTNANNVRKQLYKVFDSKAQSIEIDINRTFYLLDSVPLPNTYGEIEKILVVEKNISKQKKIKDEIEKNLQKERELNELKSRFVSMASHEFRTPLGTILSSISLIENYDNKKHTPQDKKNKHFKRIRSSVTNLNNILKDFLSFDQLEAGKVDVNLKLINISSTCKGIIDEIQTIAKVGQKIIYKHIGNDNNTYIDEQILKNILFNLLSNAIKYSNENQKIWLETIIEKKHTIIVVKDQGLGIPEIEQQHLFERFFRAQNVLNIQGTGLGLNIVKAYVNILEGEIKFDSKENIGSTFIIRLPKINCHE